MLVAGILLICTGALVGLYAAFDSAGAFGFERAWAASALLVFLGALAMFLGRSAPTISKTELFARAIERGELRLMQRMLDSGQIDPNGRAPDGQKCWLRIAVERERLPQSKLLLDKGADLNRTDGLGSSVLAYVQTTMSKGQKTRVLCEEAAAKHAAH